MFSRFFIDRPIFAAVLSIVIFGAGLIAWRLLPVAQYPDITPPTVEVSAAYPGANSQVVADTVAAPIEQQVNGVENMMYMSSQCTNDGNYSLNITFKVGTDLNIAQVLVQNRVSLAQPILPDLVKRRGITVKKKSPSVLMIVNLFSPDQSHDSIYLSNYATIQIRDELSRVEGVGDINFLGQRDYSMRLWLDPEKMQVRNLTVDDVRSAIEQQNIQVAAGQIGQPPVPTGQTFQYTMTTLGRLADPEQFANLILRADQGRIIRMRDVARIDLGAQAYDQTCTLDGRPSVALSIYQLPGYNALKTASEVKKAIEALRPSFPPGVDYSVVYDTTPFITESINEVWRTLIEATLLVAAVVLLFLQNWRSAIIPLVAVPVAISGTLAVMLALGFSLNNLTLFGLVLAIGIVVDDAIVVVEAVEHHIEHGMAPRDATIKAMDQVSGPVIAVGLVLAAVFIPCAFITGIIGQFFRQFALTIAVSTLLSAFNSLTLSPALSALLLKPREEKATNDVLPRTVYAFLGAYIGVVYVAPFLLPLAPANMEPGYARIVSGGIYMIAIAICVNVAWFASRTLNTVLAWSFKKFNQGFEKTTDIYTRFVGVALRVSPVILIIYCGLLFLTYLGFTQTPTGFVPSQDKGYLLVNVQLPDAASVERTEAVMQRIDDMTRKTPGVKHTVAIAGQSILLGANSPNYGAMYVMLDDFDARRSGDDIGLDLQRQFQKEIPEGIINVFGAPPIEGLGTAGGAKIVIEDRGNNTLDNLQQVAEKIVVKGNDDPALKDLYTSFRANTPWLYLDIDRAAAKSMGLTLGDVFSTLQVYLGSYYVNDFNLFGRTWQVNVQADAKFRRQIDDLKQLKIRNNQGKMVPFASLFSVKDVSGPVMVIRYNMYRAATINASPAEGTSSGQLIDRVEEATKSELETGMRPEWTELALLQLQTGNTALAVFVLAVVLVFLVLAAQYESWSLPFSVILVVPMCLLCSIAGVVIAHLEINIFTQVGFVVLVGLACKNAILIVEFAKTRHEEGASITDATLEACRLRLRPIMMTSLAFILGVVPLVISQGAGSEMRRALGTAVFAGMLGVTLFGVFLTPVFFFVIQWLVDKRRVERE